MGTSCAQSMRFKPLRRAAFGGDKRGSAYLVRRLQILEPKRSQCPPVASICQGCSASRLFDDPICPREKFRRECQSDLLRCLQVDHKLKFRCLLHWQISRFGTFQYLVHVNSHAPIEVSVVRPVGHQAALIDKLLLWVNSRQPVFAGKLDDSLSLGEKGASGGRHYPAHLLFLCGLKSAL